MKKKTITKTFKSFEQASKFYEKLLNEWDRVELINFPVFAGAGVYQFRVS